MTLQRWTELLQPDHHKDEGFNSLVSPVERGSTVIFKDVASLRNRDWRDRSHFAYGLHGTPTTQRLAHKLAQIENGTHCLLMPSGLAAISLVYLSLLKAGDHLLIPNNIYDPGLHLARTMRDSFNIEFDVYDPSLPDQIPFKSNTKLIWVETPGSVSMEVADLPAIAQAAHDLGVKVVVDSTWAAGLALPVLDLGGDISLQALTKYQSGGSDVFMGSLVMRDESLYDELYLTTLRYGFGVNPDDCHLILRSLPHYALRYQAQDQSARQLARFLQQQPTIAQVLHPALAGSPGHAIWQRDFTGAASLFSVLMQPHYSQAQVDAFVESLQLFRIGYSWGGAHSLVVPYDTKILRPNWQNAGPLLRFYVGLEHVDDLQNDLQQALAVLAGAKF